MDKMSSDAMWFYLESLRTGSSSQAILNQESNGQKSMVQSDTLPIECPREQLESLGFIFGDPVDDLFIAVTMPAGWKKVPTSHSMHTDLVDDKDRQRGGIFYKAAFYDRSAHMNLNRRFSYKCWPVGGYENRGEIDPQEGVVTDRGEIVWRTEPVIPTEELPRWQTDDVLCPQCIAWLIEHYPEWENPLAYWD